MASLVFAASVSACTHPLLDKPPPESSTGQGGGVSGTTAGSGSSGGSSGSATSSSSGSGAGGAVTFTDTVVMFHLNVQEHGHLTDSINYVTKVLDLHESLNLPLDVYLTTWMVDDYQEKAPKLLDRLLKSPLVSVNYHTRPPLPYRANFCTGQNPCKDWFGLYQKSESEVKAVVLDYEERRLDLATGKSIDELGGFMKLAMLYGRAPYAVGDESNGQTLQAGVDKAFQEMGASFVVSHSSQGSNPGDKRNGVLIKPEKVDVKMFVTSTSLDGDECVDPKNDGTKLYDCEIVRCKGTPPCTVAFKMHDNDFISDDSWWGVVYAKKSPPWKPEQQTEYYADPNMASFQWTRYQQVVQRAAAQRSKYAVVGAKHWAERLGVK
jgi:hypothetical protein